MTNSEIHARLARQVERRHQIWAMRQWYYDLLRRKARENAQQELFAYEEEHRSRVALCFWLGLAVVAVALVLWLVGC